MSEVGKWGPSWTSRGKGWWDGAAVRVWVTEKDVADQSKKGVLQEGRKRAMSYAGDHSRGSGKFHSLWGGVL